MDQQDQRAYLFAKVKDLIQDTQILEFVLLALEQAPDYIWEINASTSGKHHHNETQTEHVLQALKLASHLEDIMSQSVMTFITDRHISLLYAIVALHDLYKCGKPGQENLVDGQLRSDHQHPMYVAEMLKDLQVWDAGRQNFIKVSECDWWEDFARGVAGHSGPWSPIPFDSSPLQGFTNLTMLGFLCDYFASRKDIHIEF